MKIDLYNIDRRLIYLLVTIAIALPLCFEVSMPPARMKSAELAFKAVDELANDAKNIAFVALDYGPNTFAETGTQTEVIVEHLLRKRIPFALFSIYPQSEPFLNSIPESKAKALMHEMPGQTWEYGKDWINLGYRPAGGLLLQAIPKSEDLGKLFKNDAFGTPLSQLAAFKNVKTLEDIGFLAQFTSLTGTFSSYIQFFQKPGYRPLFVHGCTSITVPEAYIYMDSGQIVGLLEGIAGAAWYSELLRERYPERSIDKARKVNTGLGIAHLVIIALIVMGNLMGLFNQKLRT